MSIGQYKEKCTHPDAKDGVFHTKTGDLGQGNGYEHIVVKVGALLAKIEKENPDLIVHARSKFAGETAKNWLSTNSADNPYETGTFSATRKIEEQSKLTRLTEAFAKGFTAPLKAIGTMLAPEKYSSTGSRLEGTKELCQLFTRAMTGKPVVPSTKSSIDLNMSTGNAGMLILMQELGLEEITIAVQSDSRQLTSDLLEEIGSNNTTQRSNWPNQQTSYANYGAVELFRSTFSPT
jgi:hypothetical protein